MLGQTLPATGIPAVDQLLARLPEEAARFQRIPARLQDVLGRLAWVQPPTVVAGLRQRVASAQATYARLAAQVGNLLSAYSSGVLGPAQIVTAAGLAVAVPALQREVGGIEQDTAALTGGAVLKPGPVPGIVIGAALGFLVYGVIGAALGAAAGAYVVKGT